MTSAGGGGGCGKLANTVAVFRVPPPRPLVLVLHGGVIYGRGGASTTVH